MDATLVAGVARADITPPYGIAHANWGAQTHERAADVDHPLYATALALGDPEPAVIVDLDLLYLPPDDAARIRTTVADYADVPASHVRLSSTHTHSGPTLSRETWADAGSDMIEPYVSTLEHQIAGAAWQAVQQRRPACIAAGTATCEIAVNRRFRRPDDGTVIVGRNPDGPVDYTVGVLRIDAVDEATERPRTEPLATVIHYACHPITVGPDNALVTPDYPGIAKQTIATATASMPLFLQGAAGDIGPIHGVAQAGITEYESLGRRLGYAASQTWWAIDPTGRRDEFVDTLPSGAPLAIYSPTYDDAANQPVRVHTRDIALPLRELPAADEARRTYERQTVELTGLREQDADPATIQAAAAATRQAEIRAGLAERYGDQENESLELHVTTVGSDIALVAMPGEPFVEIQQVVHERSPFPTTWFSGYTNVGTAYLPTADAYSAGGYEVEVTPFSPEAAAHLIETTLETLTELKDHAAI